jgi:hypothetical protein
MLLRITLVTPSNRGWTQTLLLLLQGFGGFLKRLHASSSLDTCTNTCPVHRSAPLPSWMLLELCVHPSVRTEAVRVRHEDEQHQ